MAPSAYAGCDAYGIVAATQSPPWTGGEYSLCDDTAQASLLEFYDAKGRPLLAIAGKYSHPADRYKTFVLIGQCEGNALNKMGLFEFDKENIEAIQFRFADGYRPDRVDVSFTYQSDDGGGIHLYDNDYCFTEYPQPGERGPDWDICSKRDAGKDVSPHYRVK